jgi:hypothetical protein
MNPSEDTSYQERVQMKAEFRKSLLDRFTMKLAMKGHGPWENPRSETDNLINRKDYVKRTIKLLNTLNDEGRVISQK